VSTVAVGLGSRQAAVLAHLEKHPGATAGDLSRAFGLRAEVYKQLARLEQMGRIVSIRVWHSDQGREVTHWHVAPAGTVPPPAPPADPVKAERRRERERVSTRARRTRKRPARPGASRLAAAPDFSTAACRTADPDLFFAPDAEHERDRQRRAAQAKAVCAGCPIRAACLVWALNTGQVYGIWGGADEADRRAIRRHAAQRAS
jgi:WhiB family redox-sensing transcriptional regulator